MLKEFQEERATTHYSGRDYDHVVTTVNRLLSEREQIKNDLLNQLTVVLKNQDNETVSIVFSTVNNAFS